MATPLAQVDMEMPKDTHRQPSGQRLDEWTKLDPAGVEYHTTQWETPKRSTLAFEQFASTKINASSNVIDLGAGAGAATAYLAQKHLAVSFTAFDYSAELLAIAVEVAARKGVKNIAVKQGNWLNLEATHEYDGVISLQTLSWLPDYQQPLLEIFNKLQPRWIALTSLFYEGDITCRIEVEEHHRQRKTLYNVYSMPAIKRLCESNGYILKRYLPFEIDIDIEQPADKDSMGTYTRRAICANQRGFERIQFSGPLLMNWYMVLIEKHADQDQLASSMGP